MGSLTYQELLTALLELDSEQLNTKVRLIANKREFSLLDTVLDCELSNSDYSHYPLNLNTFNTEGNSPLLIIHNTGF